LQKNRFVSGIVIQAFAAKANFVGAGITKSGPSLE